MEIRIVIVLILAQMCHARTTIVKGLRTPYVYQKPPGISLDEGPCRFYFFSEECRAWISAKNRHQRTEASAFVQNSNQPLLLTQPPVLQNRKDTIKEVSSMIPMLLKSFEKLCLQDPTSPRCPRRSKKIYGPFYVSSRQSNSQGVHTQPTFSRRQPVSHTREPTQTTSQYKNFDKTGKQSQSKIVMAIVTSNKGQLSQTGKLEKSRYDICSHPFHSWQCRTRNNFKQARKIEKNLKGSSKETPRVESKPTEKKYHKCSHAFHSWLCGSKPNTTPRTVSTTEGKVDYNIPTTPKPTTRPPLTTLKPAQTHTSTKKYDKCSHPFHSWLCRRAQMPLKPTTVLPKKPTKVNVTLQPPKASPKTYMNPCSHSFHSWLCKALTFTKKKSSSQTKSSRITFPSTTPTPFTTEPSHPKVTEPFVIRTTSTLPETTTSKIGSIPFVDTLPTTIEYSTTTSRTTTYDPCSHSFHSWRCRKGKQLVNGPTTQRTTYVNYVTPVPVRKETERPKEVSSNTQTTKVKKPSWKGANPCSHAFHSWLCRPLHPKLTFKPSTGSPNWEKSFTRVKPTTKSTTEATTENAGMVDDNIPATTTPLPLPPSTTTTTTTTAPTTTTELPVTTPKVRQTKKKKYKKWDDSCNHPFHSWLCRTFKRTATIVPSYEIPNIRALPLENEFPAQILPPLNFGRIQIPVDGAAHIKRNIQSIQPEAVTEYTTTEESSRPPTTESIKPSTHQPIRYKSISFSIPTNPIFKSIPNISLLPLETSERDIGIDRPPRYIDTSVRMKETTHELVASGSQNSFLRTVLGTPETESQDLTHEDISEINYFMEFESKRMEPRKRA